jgi:hypothetical protein
MSLREYVDTVRKNRKAGEVAGPWDHTNQPRGLPLNQWQPGDPPDMPSSRGNYAPYDRIGRSRLWRNLAHAEIEARAKGAHVRQPGNTTDPVAGLSDDDLAVMRATGHAPKYAYPNTPGQTWELEHSGVQQKVRDWMIDTVDAKGRHVFTIDEARRLIRESDPRCLMPVTPLEHAFFDSEAHRSGKLRGDVNGKTFTGTPQADVRALRPLEPMTNAEVTDLADLARSRNADFSASIRSQKLRAAINAEISERNLGIPLL